MSERAHPGTVVDHGDPAADARNERATFGFWIFLMSDAVLFSLLFATWGVMWDASAGGPTVADVTGLTRSFIETVVLLVSTLTCGMMSVTLAGSRRPAHVAGWLGATLALGMIFLALELSEFAGLIRDGSTPQRSGLLSAFFVLVGTHGLHVTSGVLWGAILLAQIRAKGLVAPVTSRLTRFSLYWHFLDIVWVGIFTFVYLAGSAS